jgi:hypothetical protein
MNQVICEVFNAKKKDSDLIYKAWEDKDFRGYWFTINDGVTQGRREFLYRKEFWNTFEREN